MSPEEKYIQIEKKRGGKSFKPVTSAVWRGKPCDLRRHFYKNTLLREMVSRADMLAKNDLTGRRFVYETKWSSLLEKGYSQSAIDRVERICEGSGIFTPTHGRVRGKSTNGWIVIDHDTSRSLIEDGEQCQLNISLNSNPPRRKRGERRWKPASNSQANASPGLIREEFCASPFKSPFPQEQSPFHSPFKSPFHSPFPDDSESISDNRNYPHSQEVTDVAPAKNASEAFEFCQSLESREQEPHEVSGEPTPARSLLESKADQNLGQDESLTVSDVLSGADLYLLSDGEFDERFPSFSDYPYKSELQSCITQVVSDSLPNLYLGRQTNIRLMRRAMQSLKKKHNFQVPKGWLPAMEKLKSDPSVKVCRPFLPPPELADIAELRSLLCVIPGPFWFRENGYITETEYELLCELARRDFQEHPEFYSLISQESEGRFQEKMADRVPAICTENGVQAPSSLRCQSPAEE